MMERIVPWNGTLAVAGDSYGRPAADRLPRQAFTRLINLVHDSGRLVKRLGVERYYRNIDPISRLYGLTRFYPANSTDRYTIAIQRKNKLQLIAKKNDLVHDSQVWTLLVDGIFDEITWRKIRFAALGDFLVMADGYQTPRYFRGVDDLADLTTLKWGICGLERPHRRLAVDDEVLAASSDDEVVQHGIYQVFPAFEYEDVEISSTGPGAEPFASQWMGRDAGIRGLNLTNLPIGDELPPATLARVRARIIGGRWKRYSDDPFTPIYKRGTLGSVEAETLTDGFPWDGAAGELTAEVQDPPAASCAVALRNVIALAGGKGPQIPQPYDQNDISPLKYEQYGFANRAAVDITNTTSRTRTNGTVRITLSWDPAGANYIPYDELTAGLDFFWTNADGVTPIGWVQTDYDAVAKTVSFTLRLDELRAGTSERIYVYFNVAVDTGGQGDWKTVFLPSGGPRELVSRDHLALILCEKERDGESFVGTSAGKCHVTEEEQDFSIHSEWSSGYWGPPYGGNAAWTQSDTDEPCYKLQAFDDSRISLLGQNYLGWPPERGHIRFRFRMYQNYQLDDYYQYSLMARTITSPDTDFIIGIMWDPDGAVAGGRGYWLFYDNGPNPTTWMYLGLDSPYTWGWTTVSISWQKSASGDWQIVLSVRWGNYPSDIYSTTISQSHVFGTDQGEHWVFGSPWNALPYRPALPLLYHGFEYRLAFADVDECEADYLREDYYATGPEIRVHEADDIDVRPDWSNRVAFSARDSVHRFPSDQVRTIGEEGLSINGLATLSGNLMVFRSDGISRILMGRDIGEYTHDKAFEPIGRGYGLGAPWSLVQVEAAIQGRQLPGLAWVDDQGRVQMMTASGGIQEIGRPIRARIQALLPNKTRFERITALWTGKHRGLWIGLPETEHTDLTPLNPPPDNYPEWYPDAVLRAAMDEWTDFEGVPSPKWSELAPPDTVTAGFALGFGCRWEYERGDHGEIMFASARQMNPEVFVYGELTIDPHQDDWISTAIVPVRVTSALQGGGLFARWVALLLRYWTEGGTTPASAGLEAFLRDPDSRILTKVLDINGYRNGRLVGMPRDKELGDGLQVTLEDNVTGGLVELIEMAYDATILLRSSV